MGVAVTGTTYPVGQPSGGRDNVHGYDQSGAGIQSLLHRHLEAGVQPTGVADTSVAGGQGLGQHVSGTQVLQGNRLVQPPALG